MMGRALAALALGGLLFTNSPAYGSQLTDVQQTVSPDIINRYKQALAADSGNLTLHYLLGVALLQNNSNAEALTELTTAYPAYQDSIEAHYNLAVAALRLNDLVSTEIYLDQAITLGADQMQGIYPLAALYFNMALSSQNAGNTKEAIRYFLRALEFDPERHEVYRQLGDLYAQQGDTNDAIDAFHAYLETFPDDPVSRDYLFALEFNRAQDAVAAGNLEVAEMGFLAALELQPGSPTALYYLGYLAYTRQQPMVAAERLGEAYLNADAELHRTIRDLLYNTAISLWESGNINQALQAATILADHDHALFNELFLAATLTLKTNQFRSAHGYLLRAIELNPTDAASRQNLIAAEDGAFREWLTETRLGLEQDDLQTAEKALQMAAQLQPRSSKIAVLQKRLEQTRLHKASTSFFNAQMALDSGDLSTALVHVNSGLQVQPQDRDGLALREEIKKALALDLEKLHKEGLHELQDGNLGSAELAFAKILAISPQHSGALDGREQVHQARTRQAIKLLKDGQQAIDAGQDDRAIQLFNQLLAMDPGNEEALQGLNSARQMHTNRVNELIRKARQASDRAEYGKARQWLEQARRIDESERSELELSALADTISKKADQYSQQADRAAQKEQFTRAEKLYAKALQLLPEHTAALAGRQLLEARTDETVRTRLALAEKAMHTTDCTTAMRVYREVLEIDPEQPEALDGLHQCRKSQAAAIEKLVRNADQALNNGDYDAAAQMLTQALEQDAFHKRAQEVRQRLDSMQQAGAQPGDEQKLYLQGVAHYTQGQYEEAIKSWETVLLLNPEHEKSRQNIAKTKLKLRQLKEYSGG